MKEIKKKYSWHDVAQQNLRGYTIFLDIDGVLMADGEDTITKEIVEYVTKLKEHNDIHIVSNSFRKNRCRYISEMLKLPWVDSPHKKPSTHILKYMDYDKTKPLLVIGDKVLTDGIFAYRIKSELVLIKRRTYPNDRWYIKLSYIIDDAFFSFLKSLYTFRKILPY